MIRILDSNNIVVIVGGAGLIGRSFVSAVLESGANAVIADIAFESARQLEQNLSRFYPGRVFASAVDVTSPESVRNLIEKVEIEFGRITSMVNCAYPRNPNYGKNVEEVTYKDFCENLDLHLGGYFLITQQFCRYFNHVGKGTIVNIASIYGFLAPRFDIYSGSTLTMPVEYAAIKSAVIHMTRYFAQYYKGSNVRINCLSPGGVYDGQPTGFVDKYNSFGSTKGMLSPEDLNGPLIFLLSDMSRYITGQNIVVDDGWSL